MNGTNRGNARSELVVNNSLTENLSLHIDRSRVHVGSDVTGRVDFIGNRKVIVEFEGLEYTVVALPGRVGRDYEESDIRYLERKTSQKRIFLRQTRNLSCGESNGFRFGLPDNIPGTIRRQMDGTNSLLPSQCQIKYSVSVILVPSRGDDCTHEVKSSEEIFVLAKKEVDIPIDPVIGVSIGSAIEALYQNIFLCGKMQGIIDTFFACNFPSTRRQTIEQDDAVFMQDRCIYLNASKSKLHLCIGQTLILEVNDCFRLLSRQQNSIWMFKLTEELSWEAQGRKTTNKETWNLHFNNHAIPTLIPSYDHNYDSLIQVHHTLAVYMATKEKPTEYLASTGPIQVKIISSRVGWDA